MANKKVMLDASTTATPSTAIKKNTRNIPNTDADFLTLAKAVGAKWKATPTIKLLWMDEPTYKVLVDCLVLK